MKLSQDIVRFLEQQGFVIVSTLDQEGNIHCSAKGIAGMETRGKIYVIDLYLNRTYKNLKRDPRVSLTAVDEHRFKGYTLQGKAKIVTREEIKDHIIHQWEERIIKRISARVVRGVQEKKKSRAHFEAELPHPKYLIEIDVENVIDLAPPRKEKKQ